VAYLFLVRSTTRTVDLSRLSLITVLSLVTACGPSMVTQYRGSPNGQLVPTARFTQDELWKNSVREQISDELAGKPPGKHYRSWKERWTIWYAVLRDPRNHLPGWHSAEFANGEQMAACIRQERRAHGLPAYDP